MRTGTFPLLVFLLSPAASTAQDVCPTGEALAVGGPVGISAFEGDTGRPRRICPRTELSLAGAGTLEDVVDDLSGTSGNFYATIQGGIEIAGSYRHSDRLELFATVQGLLLRFVQNATLTGTHLGPGWTAAGGTFIARRSESLAVGLTARLTLPTAFGYSRNMWPFWFDLGLLASFRPLHTLWIHGQLGALASLALGAAASDPRGALQLMAGVEYSPWSSFAAVLDLGALLGYQDPLDAFSINPGVRFRIWQDLGLELAASVPVAGSARTNIGALLRVRYGFAHRRP